MEYFWNEFDKYTFLAYIFCDIENIKVIILEKVSIYFNFTIHI